MAKPTVVPRQLADSEAQRWLAQIACDSSAVIFTSHARQQMRKRGISARQVIECLKKGLITESAFLDLYGNWKLTIERYAAGERIGCAVCIDINKANAIVITAFLVR